jgi:tRNA(Ile)-lysidine synthase
MILDRNTFKYKTTGSIFCDGQHRIILAFSGGVDSVVLSHLLMECGLEHEIAHVNYGLRGEESEIDQQFIQQWANNNKMRFHLLNARYDSSNSGKGIQEWARETRYSWLEALRNNNTKAVILTAHHSNDQAETILFQFIRGGGLTSLSGMKEISGSVFRPLLSFSKEQIVNYAGKNKLPWREDSSNESVKYSRNFIRKNVIPLLQDINPSIAQSLSERSHWFAEYDFLVNEKLNSIIEAEFLFKEEEEESSVNIDWLANFPAKLVLVWHWIEPFGFTSAQVNEVLDLFDALPGKFVQSNQYTIWKDRDVLTLKKNNSTFTTYIEVREIPFIFESDCRIELSFTGRSSVKFNVQKGVEFLNAENIVFPLCIRTWLPGDQFKPLGMSGHHQKVSDYLIQKKIPLHQKSAIRVLLNKDEVICVLGHRISEDYKLTESTNKILRVEFSGLL